ncbi:MAG: GAF domain-containing protein [Gemmatimonadaceae bacterium]|nr:GAF domain-containing protein [Gloeobacterales cyanobacterium ES-bin-141]
MQNPALPTVLEEVLNRNHEPRDVFSALLPVLCDILQSDRCFLYLRNPETRVGMITHCWRRAPEYPDVTDSDWKKEPESLPEEDPLFAAALRTDASIFVEDVETADPAVVNLAFEQKSFGHRALIHSHLCYDGHLWGVLQPCIFGRPRVWTEFDRDVIARVERRLTPLVVTFVKATGV